MNGLTKVVTMAAALCAFAAAPAFADSVITSTSSGFGRIVFTFDPAANATAQMTSGVVTVKADRKIALDPSAIARNFGDYVASARLDPNGMTLRIALSQDAKLHTSVSANRFAVDLAPPSFAGTPPDLPPPPPKVAPPADVAKLPALSIRAGAYSNFSRIVFDWTKTVAYKITPGTGHLSIRFEAAQRPDFSAFERIAPPWVKLAGWRVENGGTVVEFTADPGSRFHDFRDGAHIVLDVLSPKTDAQAYKPPGDKSTFAIRSLSADASTPKTDAKADAKADTKQAAASTDATAKAAAQAQALVDAQSKEPADKTAQPQQTADATATSQVPAPAPITAGAQRTRDGAVIMFANAAYHPTAVFERGATVWIVLDGAPPVDIDKLRTALGDFPSALDVSASNGTSIVRVTLKQPEAVSADAIAGNLKVTIAPQIGKQPIAIGFVRNDDAPNGAYLTTLVPGALRQITMDDPSVGDTLVIIPAIPGRGMVAQKSFVDFNAIPTAAGLVIVPLADDVAVAVNQSRIRIGRPNGLVLNANPAAVAQTPADLTRPGDGPTFVDFTRWAKAPGKGFLDSERRLRAMITKQKPQELNMARGVLARFYVANQFVADALGLVNLMQATDPTLQGDAQLQIIRAASNYMMGRYSDAHNILAATAFDNDPHAALWRGLTESALGNEAAARQALTVAEPVLSHYPMDWQSRARIAQAEAALAAGSLES
ncbi:MAG: hypothetical protein ACTHPD_15600, partial [Rhizomicrobium sp.]